MPCFLLTDSTISSVYSATLKPACMSNGPRRSRSARTVFNVLEKPFTISQAQGCRTDSACNSARVVVQRTTGESGVGCFEDMLFWRSVRQNLRSTFGRCLQQGVAAVGIRASLGLLYASRANARVGRRYDLILALVNSNTV
jgi:hypothetical protein